MNETPSAAEKQQLTPHECAEQFRMYARSNNNPEAVHQLNFCADFLDEFCHSGQAVDDPPWPPWRSPKQIREDHESAQAGQAVDRQSQGRCDTTMTERFDIGGCDCPTYPENLGPCATYRIGSNGRCVYCDHNEACHKKVRQAVDRQEEAYEKLQIKCQGCGVSWFIEIPSETWWSGALSEANDLMNRELTAERQRHPTYETVLEALDILTKAYDERGQPNTLVALAERAAETKQQLLSALAALKELQDERAKDKD